MRPRLLDLFCCQGGAAVGYHRAGFDVVGVDIEPQPRYPFEFYQADALAFPLDGFDAIHASPPCQHASAGTRAIDRTRYPELVEPTRARLAAAGVPYVIENVVGADLRSPLALCGCMFDLGATDDDGTPLHLRRKRLFESNVLLAAPRPCRHDRAEQVAGVYGGARSDKHEARHVRRGGYVPASRDVKADLLGGADWMTVHGMHQAIPPAYTEWIGRQLLPFC